MAVSEEIPRFLADPHPLLALRAMLADRLGAGTDRASLERELAEAMRKAYEEGREDEGDLALDGLDLLVGWCAPGLRL